MGRIALTGVLLILPDGPRNLTLHLDGRHIATVGGSPQPGDRVVDLTGHAVFPGLINAHDHLDLNHLPRLKCDRPYSHAREWFHELPDLLNCPELADLTGVSITERFWFGGIKNLLAGVTTVAHCGDLPRLVRSKDFPTKVLERYGWVESLPYYSPGADLLVSYRRTPPDAPWFIHLAEGLDSLAGQELEHLDALGCLHENTVLIDGVGLTEVDLERMLEVGAGLVWCPETNRFLLGETHFHALLMGRMGLGTDSRLTGSFDMLEEMKVAAQASKLPTQRLVEMVVFDAARLLGLPFSNRFERDAPADLIAIDLRGENAYEALLRLHRADLRLVMVDGCPRLADPDLEPLFRWTRTAVERIMLDGKPKLLAGNLYRRLIHMTTVEPGLELSPRSSQPEELAEW